MRYRFVPNRRFGHLISLDGIYYISQRCVTLFQSFLSVDEPPRRAAPRPRPSILLEFTRNQKSGRVAATEDKGIDTVPCTGAGSVQ